MLNSTIFEHPDSWCDSFITVWNLMQICLHHTSSRLTLSIKVAVICKNQPFLIDTEGVSVNLNWWQEPKGKCNVFIQIQSRFQTMWSTLKTRLVSFITNCTNKVKASIFTHTQYNFVGVIPNSCCDLSYRIILLIEI